MNYNELYKVLRNLYIEWHKKVEESSAKMSLWEFIAKNFLETCDITVKEAK